MKKKAIYIGGALCAVLAVGIVLAAGTPTTNPLFSTLGSFENRVRMIMGMPLPTGNESSAYEGAHLFSTCKNGASGSQCTGSLEGVCVSMHTAALRNLMILDAASVPADGALGSCANTNPPCVAKCIEGWSQSTDPTESSKCIDWVNHPVQVTTGLVVELSTSTSGCTTLAKDGNNDWIQADITIP